jgi:hypothetical protein
MQTFFITSEPLKICTGINQVQIHHRPVLAFEFPLAVHHKLHPFRQFVFDAFTFL